MTIWQIIKRQPSTLAWAIFVHLLVFAAIALSFTSSETKVTAVKTEKVIQAVAIDESKINEEINKLKKSEKQKVREQKRLQDSAKKAKAERRKEEKRLAALRKKQKQEALKNKKQREEEAKRLAELEQKRKEQEIKKKEAEEQLSKLEKERAEKKAELEREEKQRQQEAAAKKQEQFVQSEVARYTDMIKSEITRRWVFPASYQKGMKCKIVVRLIPSGDVVSTTIVQSSGNPAFDRSVEMAVQKASPLPVPDSSSGLFDHFRELQLVFDPNA